MLLVKEEVVNNESENVEEGASKKVAKEVEATKILKLLNDIDVCKICATRITSENNSIAHIYGEYNVEESEEKQGSHCFLCLGILEESNLCAAAKRIVQKMEDSNYDSPTFALGVAIPFCAMLRKSSITTYLTETINPQRTVDFPALKNVAKFFLLKLIEKFSKKTHDQRSDLFIKLEYNFPGSSEEMERLKPLLHPPAKKIKLEDDKPSKFSAAGVIKSLSVADVKKYVIYPPQPLSEGIQFKASVINSSLFIGGRYNKYSRTLGHTWEEGAAQEYVGTKILEVTRGTGIKFITTGVEEVDVRILGKGKPFVAEVIDPKVCLTEEKLAKLQADVSSTDTVAVHDLQKVNRAGVELIRSGEKGKIKVYRAILSCFQKISDKSIKKLNNIKDIEINQDTPIRLLHKRVTDARPKKIHEVELKRRETDGYYELNVKVEAGTSIKEFVHGDFGRTEPSLGTLLGVEVEVQELDFISIDINWPPELEGTEYTTKEGEYIK